MTPARRRGQGGFFGRRKTKALTARQQGLVDRLLPALRVDIGGRPADPAALFARPVRAVRLEIGIGGGEHLCHAASLERETGLVGAEPFINGIAKTLRCIEAGQIDNIRLFDDDAQKLLDWLPAGCLDGVDLLYPDPWPKRRHWKRRFVNPGNLDRIARVLKPGGRFRFVSDIDHYVNWTLRHCLRRDDLRWTAWRRTDWTVPWPDWLRTRYEAKAIRAGRHPAYLQFRKESPR